MLPSSKYYVLVWYGETVIEDLYQSVRAWYVLVGYRRVQRVCTLI